LLSGSSRNRLPSLACRRTRPQWPVRSRAVSDCAALPSARAVNEPCGGWTLRGPLPIGPRRRAEARRCRASTS